MPTDFTAEHGVDYACVTDLDPSLTLRDTRVTLGESCARRIITPRGGLFYDRDYGNCVRRFLHASGFSANQIARFVEAEILKDERVNAVAADVEFDTQTETLTIRIRVKPVTNEIFDLTLSVDDLTVELLQEDVVT